MAQHLSTLVKETGNLEDKGNSSASQRAACSETSIPPGESTRSPLCTSSDATRTNLELDLLGLAEHDNSNEDSIKNQMKQTSHIASQNVKKLRETSVYHRQRVHVLTKDKGPDWMEDIP